MGDQAGEEEVEVAWDQQRHFGVDDRLPIDVSLVESVERESKVDVEGSQVDCQQEDEAVDQGDPLHQANLQLDAGEQGGEDSRHGGAQEDGSGIDDRQPGCEPDDGGGVDSAKEEVDKKKEEEQVRVEAGHHREEQEEEGDDQAGK